MTRIPTRTPIPTLARRLPRPGSEPGRGSRRAREKHRWQAFWKPRDYSDDSSRPLDTYLAEIRHIRVLTPEEEVAPLSSHPRRGRSVPGDPPRRALHGQRRIVDWWKEIKQAGRITGTIAVARRGDGEDDRSASVDFVLTQVDNTLRRRDRLTARPSFDPERPSAPALEPGSGRRSRPPRGRTSYRPRVPGLPGAPSPSGPGAGGTRGRPCAGHRDRPHGCRAR